MNVGSPTPVSLMDPFRQTAPTPPEAMKRPDDSDDTTSVTKVEAVPASPLPAAVGKGIGLLVDVTI